MRKIKIGILGAGNIANYMAEAVKKLPDWVEPYAVAARDEERAREFAEKWGFEKFYGSYETMVQEPEVELVYVATPHSHHYGHAKLCLEHGKAVLVEKAFTANAAQAAELIQLAEEEKLFLGEAMWTRFLPARELVKQILEEKMIGEPISLTGEFSVPISHKQRMYDPALAGGALLDLGIYALTFASMYFGDDIREMHSDCVKYETGVDATDRITIVYQDGKEAQLKTSFVSGPVNEGTIMGTDGSVRVENLNNYTAIQILDREGRIKQELSIPDQINGYEYEVIAAVKAIRAGETECAEMPHAETMVIMRQMDALRKEWGVTYPFE